jgi:hypothetical protein
MILLEVDKNQVSNFLAEYHYSPVMPKLTRHYLGCFVNKKMVGAITFGWGTRPKHTIKKLFPDLDTLDYFEIGKMAMDNDMPRNSESQMLKLSIQWLRENTKIKYLYTWADGIVGKPGYVYQGSNFLYGGFITTDTYVTESGERVHPRTMQGLMPKKEGLKMGPRPTPQQLNDMNISRVKGRQFRYIFPMKRKYRRYLKNSTVDWTINYPKDKDLIWSIKKPYEDKYTETTTMPFDISKEVEMNKRNVESYRVKQESAEDIFSL